MKNKILKRIGLFVLFICSFFSSITSKGINVKAVDTSKTYPITDYKKGSTQNLNTTNLDWFNGDYNDYETYLFNFNSEVNDSISYIKNIKVRYQTCKFSLSGKCRIYSKYVNNTISSDYYYNSTSVDYNVGGATEFEYLNLGAIGATGKIEDYEKQAFKYFQGYLQANILEDQIDGKTPYYEKTYHEEFTSFNEYYELNDYKLKYFLETSDNSLWSANFFLDGNPNASSSSKEGPSEKYNIKTMLEDFEKYDWYFIMPVEETMYNLVISAEVVDVNGNEWEMKIDSVLNDRKSGNTFANFVEDIKEFFNKIVNFFNENIWVLYGLIGLLIYSILSIFITPLLKIFELIWFLIKYTIGLPITLLFVSIRNKEEEIKFEKKLRKIEQKREKKFKNNSYHGKSSSYYNNKNNY